MKQAVFDIEANHLEPEKVTSVWCIVVKDLETEEVFKYGPDDIQRGVDKLNTYDRLIGHNIIYYDAPVLARLFGLRKDLQLMDTLVLSRLANPDRRVPWGWKGTWAPHGLEAWGMRFGKPKVEWDKWDEWHPEMLNRCEQDVNINFEVYKALYHEFKE